VTILPRPVTRRDVKKFIDYCVILRAFWTHYQTIFEGSDLQRELLQNTAHKFFFDLNRLLIEHLILQIRNLTDPEMTMGKRNLTIPFLVNNADFAATPRDMAKLKKIAARIDRFRKRIGPARNKLISHLDLDAAHRRKSLGGASVAAWQKFWLDLQGLVTILHKRYVDARVPFCLNGVAMISDADQLVQAMKESSYFRVLLGDRNLTRRVSDVAFSSKYHGA
jgi:HEPN superfamily AbiU2-like protein